jgi:hypothetical protein
MSGKNLLRLSFLKYFSQCYGDITHYKLIITQFCSNFCIDLKYVEVSRHNLKFFLSIPPMFVIQNIKNGSYTTSRYPYMIYLHTEPHTSS